MADLTVKYLRKSMSHACETHDATSILELISIGIIPSRTDVLAALNTGNMSISPYEECFNVAGYVTSYVSALYAISTAINVGEYLHEILESRRPSGLSDFKELYTLYNEKMCKFVIDHCSEEASLQNYIKCRERRDLIDHLDDNVEHYSLSIFKYIFDTYFSKGDGNGDENFFTTINMNNFNMIIDSPFCKIVSIKDAEYIVHRLLECFYFDPAPENINTVDAENTVKKFINCLGKSQRNFSSSSREKNLKLISQPATGVNLSIDFISYLTANGII